MRTPHPRRVQVTGDFFHPRLPNSAIWATRNAPGHPRSLYANPHRVGATSRRRGCKACHGVVHDRAEALVLYGQHLDQHPEIVAEAVGEPEHSLFACWCALDEACHVDVLLHRADQFATNLDETIKNTEGLELLLAWGRDMERREKAGDPALCPGGELADWRKRFARDAAALEAWGDRFVNRVGELESTN